MDFSEKGSRYSMAGTEEQVRLTGKFHKGSCSAKKLVAHYFPIAVTAIPEHIKTAPLQK